MERLRLATAWLGGCSGCHMSLLDLDEGLAELARMADIVYCPFVDAKEFPERVDVALVEGAIANDDHVSLARTIRSRSKVVASFGDCAVTGNVTAMRNFSGGAKAAIDRAYVELPDVQPGPPAARGILPVLLDPVLPLHAVVAVDHWLPGCPPDAERIRSFLWPLLEGRAPTLDASRLRFG